jgi:hypothetical protein
MTGGIVATSIVFFPAAPFFLFMHGKEITIPKGTEITAYVNGNAQLEFANFQSGAPAEPTSRATPGSVTQSESHTQALLDISSTPEGADIEIDGNFVGNTPSSVGLSSGEHTIKVSKDGYQTWQRHIKELNRKCKAHGFAHIRQFRASAHGKGAAIDSSAAGSCSADALINDAERNVETGDQ